MENELTKEKLIELRDGMEIKTKEVMNQAIDAIVKKDLNAYTKNFALLKTYVQALNNHMRYVQYAELAEDDKPVIAAVKKFFVEQYIITEEKDDHDGSIKTLSLTKKNASVRSLIQHGATIAQSCLNCLHSEKRIFIMFHLMNYPKNLFILLLRLAKSRTVKRLTVIRR